MKRFFGTFLVLVLCMSICAPAFAAERQEAEIDNEGAILITVDSQEEYDMVIRELEAHNLRAYQLWRQALAESTLLENNMTITNMVTPLSSYVVNSVRHIDTISLTKIAFITFSATYSTVSNSTGALYIGEIRDIDAFGSYSTTTVSVRDYDYTVIDGGETLAADFSCQVGVRTSSDEEFSYFARHYYVEFYASGGSHVYD